jgi:hypothetical protein
MRFVSAEFGAAGPAFSIDADRRAPQSRPMTPRSRLVATVLILVLGTAAPASASDASGRFEAVAADVIIARPCWLVATVVGTGLFIVALPVAAMSKSVNKTARTLVGKPAEATFTRPLGDFSTVE